MSHLPSLAGKDGNAAIGPTDVSFTLGGLLGYVTVGLGANPAAREQFPQAAGMGKLYSRLLTGRMLPVADVAGFEAKENPDADKPGAEVDSNPYSVDATGLRGPSLLGVLPFKLTPAPDIPGFPVPPGTPIPTQSVPTSIVRGPVGAYYVGRLTGFPHRWRQRLARRPRPGPDRVREGLHDDLRPRLRP